MNRLFIKTISIVVIAIGLSTFMAKAQMTASVSSPESNPSPFNFTISIPSEYTANIIRENKDDAVFYSFKKTDGSKAFLFQVSKISEEKWMKIKDQLSNPTVLDHKNGFVYYALATDKSRIKGTDDAAYEQVYYQLHQVLRSIVIME